MNSQISIIIPSWNGKKLLEESLPTVINLKSVSKEIIVIDNGSTDGTKSWLKEKYPQIKVFGFKKNMGFPKAVNLGIKKSKFPVIALVNNDITLDPDWGIQGLAVMAKSENIMMVATRIMLYDGLTIDSAGDFIDIDGSAKKRGHRLPAKKKYLKRAFCFSPCAAAALYKRELFEKIGLFDEYYFAYYEDIDLGFRAQLAGYDCIYEPKIVAYHHLGGTSKKWKKELFSYISSRNVLYLTLKNMPSSLIKSNLHRIIAFNIRDIIAKESNTARFFALLGKISIIFSPLRIIRERKKSYKFTDTNILKKVISFIKKGEK